MAGDVLEIYLVRVDLSGRSPASQLAGGLGDLPAAAVVEGEHQLERLVAGRQSLRVGDVPAQPIAHARVVPLTDEAHSHTHLVQLVVESSLPDDDASRCPSG